MSNLPITVNLENDYSIEKLNRDLHETIALLKRLGTDTKGLEKIQQQLYVLNLFVNRQIVSIAGLQSVGKTSLIKRYLNFEEDLLEAEVGVGEKRPVLISADDTLNSPAYYCVKTRTTKDGYIDMALQSISKEELNKGVQNPPEDALWYEIKIPKNDKIGHLTLALLPGFERNKQSDSQLFLDLFLNCSTGMILVLNHIRLAQASQHELLDKVSKTYKEKTPGFVLTFADDLNDEEKRNTIKANLMKQFQMDSDEQILFSDFSDESVPSKLEKLIKQNSKYAINSVSLHVKQQLLVGEHLSMYLAKAEQSIKSKFLADQETQSFKYNQRQLTNFKEQYLETVRETLKIKMDTHVTNSEKQVVEALKNEKDSIGKKIKSFFKNDLSYKEVQELKDWVENIYSTEDPYKTNTIIVNAIGEASEQYLYKRLPIVVKTIEDTNKKHAAMTLTEDISDFGDFENSADFSNEFGSMDDFTLSTEVNDVELITESKPKEMDLRQVFGHILPKFFLGATSRVDCSTSQVARQSEKSL